MTGRARVPCLALVDWGIGGMGVRKALRAADPDLAVTYFSDTGAVPYGRLAPRDLHARLDAVIDALASMGVTSVFLACNAASTSLVRGARYSLPAEGMIDAGVAVVHASGARRVGVVGGRRTIASQVYRRGLESCGIEVRQRVAQPLSAAIEAGQADAGRTSALIRRITSPLRDFDAVLLACTHYPAATSAFAAALPGVELLDPAATAAAQIVRRARLFEKRSEEPSADLLLTTGDPRGMRHAARAAFGVELGEVIRTHLPAKTVSVAAHGR